MSFFYCRIAPVATAKDSDLYVTQFGDKSVVENAGLLKMDFLGLKTLTLIKDTVKIVKAKHGIQLNPDEFPLDDTATYELFQWGDTVGIFQYESVGMQKHLKDLNPLFLMNDIDDLMRSIGLVQWSTSRVFIARKNGEEEIAATTFQRWKETRETYGITVYQEQVMLLSQKLANFSKGESGYV